MKGEGNQIWGTRVARAGKGYRSHVLSRLNGKVPLTEEPNVRIASGTTGVWQWEVRTVRSLVPSYEQWTSDPKIQERAKSDEWTHSIASWDQAFARAYKVVSYLLGHEPMPLNLVVVLVPANTQYEKNESLEHESAVPLRFMFYYPPAGEGDSNARYGAMINAVTTSVYEYQHGFVDTKTIKPIGRSKADRTINDEARSQCWSDSVFLALTSGSHTEFAWEGDGAGRSSLDPKPGETPPTDKERYINALKYAWTYEALTLVDYLRQRGVTTNKFLANDPPPMNAVLSACRALTQKPFDLTSGPYPKEQIEFVPFFPDPLPPAKLAPEAPK